MSDASTDCLQSDELSGAFESPSDSEPAQFHGDFAEPLLARDMQRMLSLTDRLRSVGYVLRC